MQSNYKEPLVEKKKKGKQHTWGSSPVPPGVGLVLADIHRRRHTLQQGRLC
jgi:hypothetical protein